MTSVAVIGLGAMGGAVADALLAAGHEVTVWNRSAARMSRFRETPARCAESLQQAIERSDTIVVCISDYSATKALFDNARTKSALAKRTLIQCSTGTPREAREAEQWADPLDAAYLDAAILAYPPEVGNEALIAVAGRETVWQQQQAVFDALSNDVRYLGDAVGAAAALDVAVLSYYVCAHLGLVHGALICESEGVEPSLLTDVIADSLPSDVEELRKLGSKLQTGDFSDADASIAVYSGVIERILDQARDAGMNSDIPAFAQRVYGAGMEAGLDDEEVLALVKVLRSRANSAHFTD